MAASAAEAGNAAFVAEDWNTALSKFMEACSLEPGVADHKEKLAATHIKLGDFAAALREADAALTINDKHSKAFLRKGVALFSLNRIDDARTALEQGQALEPSSSAFKTWLKKVTEAASASSDAAPAAAAPADDGKEHRCHNIGCGAKYFERDNGDAVCHYHPGPPIFHDGKREWACCHKKASDFDAFMTTPPCATGRHNPNKSAAQAPVGSGLVQRLQAANDKEAAAAAAGGPVKVTPNAPPAKTDPANCVRCKNGYMCQEHGKQSTTYVGANVEKKKAEAAKVAADPTIERGCKNKGCGKKFKPVDNEDTACRFHPGPPIFHDAAKKWGCCNKSSHDFDEWVKIPGCQVGRHEG